MRRRPIDSTWWVVVNCPEPNSARTASFHGHEFDIWKERERERDGDRNYLSTSVNGKRYLEWDKDRNNRDKESRWEDNNIVFENNFEL